MELLHCLIIQHDSKKFYSNKGNISKLGIYVKILDILRLGGLLLVVKYVWYINLICVYF